MSREEMIEILIEDRICDWVYAQNKDTLRDFLKSGFDGFDDYTDEKLSQEMEEFGEVKIRELKNLLRWEEMSRKENKITILGS